MRKEWTLYLTGDKEVIDEFQERVRRLTMNYELTLQE